jgi:nicotinate-nucleotide pyrophosphorylase (carboxylating)
MVNNLLTHELIRNALREDIGTGDITTISTVPAYKEISGNLIVKEKGILCGVHIFEEVFQQIDQNVKCNMLIQDGEFVEPGQIIGKIQGNARSILTGERVALNFLQRLSGVATQTAQFVNRIKETKTKIVDTRKTTPGLRSLEKYAVKVGGGFNHRFNLSDGILIKDNHISAAGGIMQAVESAKLNGPHTLKIEVEVETLDQVEEALKAKADIILLDNMHLEMMKKAMNIIGNSALTEASGNMEYKDIEAIANLGIDFISIGALTHTVKALDISLKLNDE